MPSFSLVWLLVSAHCCLREPADRDPRAETTLGFAAQRRRARNGRSDVCSAVIRSNAYLAVPRKYRRGGAHATSVDKLVTFLMKPNSRGSTLDRMDWGWNLGRLGKSQLWGHGQRVSTRDHPGQTGDWYRVGKSHTDVLQAVTCSRLCVVSAPAMVYRSPSPVDARRQRQRQRPLVCSLVMGVCWRLHTRRAIQAAQPNHSRCNGTGPTDPTPALDPLVPSLLVAAAAPWGIGFLRPS